MDLTKTYRVLSIAATVLVKAKLHILCKVYQIRNTVLQCQVLQVLGSQIIVWRGFAPVSVY